MRPSSAIIAVLATLVLAYAPSAQEKGSTVTITAHVVEPDKLAADDGTLAKLRVPEGFRVTRFAEGLGDPRIMAVARDGSLYVTRRKRGDVILLRDADGDGRAEAPVVIARRPQAHGVAVTDTKLYLATVTDVYVADRRPDGTIGALRRIIDDLPHAGQHPNRTIAVGPDAQLYISVGSTCNACDETSPEHATLLRATPDGSSRVIFASGLRNTIGFAWHPTTLELFGMDHGIDWLGDEDQPEEFNRLAHGKQYGWPYIYADGRENPQDEPPGGIPAAQWARMSEVPVLSYVAHAAPMQMVFYEGAQFPGEYRHDGFVAMHGSWNRRIPSGYEVVRIRFDKGTPVAMEPFLTGFLTQQAGGRWGFTGRPVGLAVMPDGSLLVGDDENGVIYRVSYQARDTRPASRPTAAAPASPRAEAAAPAPRALATRALAAPAGLRVTSPAFAAGTTIPTAHSDYGQKYSPAVQWSGAPAATQSFVVLMEDPDAAMPKPFVHWVVYNLPPAITALPDAVPTLPRLPEFGGALQGRTSRGSVGYFGPRPPESDGPHHYHFQVFALDTMLTLDPGASAERVLDAMRGHVLASGDLQGLFKAPAAAPK